MVEYASLRAKEKGATTLVALSTQNFGFFTGVAGFEEADKSILPEARLKTYEESGRNPRVLVKTLEPVPPVAAPSATAPTAAARD
jgi:amino-acid N-acetyltransferase